MNKTKWPDQVCRDFAEADGLKPEDFQWMQWPVSNVRIEKSDLRVVPFWLWCNVPVNVPQANQYVLTFEKEPGIEYEKVEGDYWKVPDPVGIALSRVKFKIRNADTKELLSEDSSSPSPDGLVQCMPSNRNRLWDTLKPGTSIEVRLEATPLFYYLSAAGGTHLEYALQNRGYFGGETVESEIYTLLMDEDGNLTIGESKINDTI